MLRQTATLELDFATVIALEEAIGAAYDCGCSLVRTVSVHHLYKNRVLWRGLVGVFRLEAHPEAGVCFAWMGDEVHGTNRPVLMLRTREIDTPADAVRAHIVQDCQMLCDAASI